MDTKQTIKDFELVYIAHEYPDYYQGVGVNNPDYDHCVSGCDSLYEKAVEDLIEQLAQVVDSLNHSTVENILFGLLTIGPDEDKNDGEAYGVKEDDCPLHYVGIRYNLCPV